MIARSFADIFRANALKNGLVPVAVDADVHRCLVEHADAEVTHRRRARGRRVVPDGGRGAVPARSVRAPCLTQGIDELEYLRRHETAHRASWEARHG